MKTIEEVFPIDKIGTYSQSSESGALYVPKNIEEVEERAKRDAERFMKRFGTTKLKHP